MTVEIMKIGDGEITSQNEETRDVNYIIVGTPDAARAYGAFRSYIWRNARTLGDLKFQSVRVKVKPDAYDVFDGIVTYSSKRDDVARWAGSTKGGTAHITQSLETVARGSIDESGFVPDFKGLINVQDGEAQGVDVQRPTWQHSVSISYPKTVVSDEYLRALYQLTGTVNDAAVWFFKRGELLFEGVDWSTREQTNDVGELEIWYDFTFSFTGMPNTIVEREGMSPLAKEGHQYYWVYTWPKKDEPTETVVSRPVAAYVERMYEYSDFSFFAF